jgi:endonuclease YncB( thermonuclease family)
VTHYPSFAARPRQHSVIVVAAAMFALGLLAGATIWSALAPHIAVPVEPAFVAAPAGMPAATNSRAWQTGLAYPAEVLRVIDGDTFEARVRVWPGLDVNTKVRLRGIDAPELHARCGDELTKAQAARAALDTILAEGGVAISRVGIDKYGGRVDAAVATRATADVSAALLNGGFARSYDGGKRAGWCG